MDAAPDISRLTSAGMVESAVPIAESADRLGVIAEHPRPQHSRSHKSTFVTCAFVVVAILMAYNLVISRVARTSQRRALMAKLARIPSDTDVLFLGNSLVEAGCDVSAFQDEWGKAGTKMHAVNIALGATFPIEHSLILQRALNGQAHPKYVIYGFFDDELNAMPSGNFADLVGNRALAYYFPGEAAELYAPGSALKKWELRVCGTLPMISERSSLWGKVDFLREKFQQVGMPHRDRNRFGFVQNFSALEATDVKEFERRCLAAAEKNQFSPPVQKIIRLTREQGTKLVLVEMPMPSRHRNVFYSTKAWSVLRDRMQKLAMENHLIYISATDWVQDDTKFEDVTHLNEAGAKEFSVKLARALAAY